MKTKMSKPGKEMSINFSALENFALTKEEMVKLFGGNDTGDGDDKNTPIPIVKEDDDD